jgi:rhodanese-related sulfurtransferase
MKELGAMEAYTELSSLSEKKDLVYLDVRTPEEYADHHAKLEDDVKVVNIPVMFFTPGGTAMATQEQFEDEIKKEFPDAENTKFMVG